MPFGLKGAPATFEIDGNSTSWVAIHLGVYEAVVLLDVQTL
jgi:hypothetical protein